MSIKIADLDIGSKIKLGKYSIRGEEPHDIVWVKVHRDNTFMSLYVEDLRSFDAKEPNNIDEMRREYGNNEYAVSNIDMFLNSSENIWFDQKHEYDAEPNEGNTYDNTPYASHSGFLKHFTDDEIDAIEYSKIISAVPDSEPTEIERKIFLPSLTNVFGNKNNGVDEGSYWDYYNMNGAMHKARINNNVVEHSTCSTMPNRNDNWYYWLRSAQCGNRCRVFCVDQSGNYGNCNAYRGMVGLRPALKLNPNILLSINSETNECYVLDFLKNTVQFSTDEIANILKI